MIDLPKMHSFGIRKEKNFSDGQHYFCNTMERKRNSIFAMALMTMEKKVEVEERPNP